MTKYRRNAVVIDFNFVPVRPDIESVSTFISKGLKLDLSRTKNLQFNNSRNHVIIELGSPEEASELADHHNLKHKVGCRGKGYAIPIFVEDDAVQIRVHDLPPHMPNDVIIAHLEAYGEVKSIRNEVWREYFPGIPNGVRAVRMVLKKQIPSFITVEEDLAYINYPNQQKTCRHCCKPLHQGTKCNVTKTTTKTPTPTAPTPVAPTPVAPTPKAPSPTAPTKPSPANTTITKTISSITTTTTNTANLSNNNNNQPKQKAEVVPQKNESKQMDISSEDDESDKTIEEIETASATTTTTTSDLEEHTDHTKRTRPKRSRQHVQQYRAYDPWTRRFVVDY